MIVVFIITGLVALPGITVGCSVLTPKEMEVVRGACRYDCVTAGNCNSGSVDCGDVAHQSESCYRCATSLTEEEPKHERCQEDADGEYSRCKTVFFEVGCNFKTYGLCQYLACNVVGQEPSDNGCGATFYGPEFRKGCDTD